MSHLSCRVYGVMMLAPKLALETAESIYVLAVAAYMNAYGFFIVEIGNSTPSTSTLKELMIKEAVETIILEQDDMKAKLLTIICDKGEGLSL